MTYFASTIDAFNKIAPLLAKLSTPLNPDKPELMKYYQGLIDNSSAYESYKGFYAMPLILTLEHHTTGETHLYTLRVGAIPEQLGLDFDCLVTFANPCDEIVTIQKYYLGESEDKAHEIMLTAIRELLKTKSY